MAITYPKDMTVTPTVVAFWLTYNWMWNFTKFIWRLTFLFEKCQLICSYNPHRNSIRDHMRLLFYCIYQNIQKYENIISMWDYNAKITETSTQEVCKSHFLENMMKKTTCFKDPAKSACMDLLITNNPGIFQNGKTYENLTRFL